MKTAGPYVIEYGEVWYRVGTDNPGAHICGPSEEVAIVYDVANAILHKHGSADRVRKWTERAQKSLIAAGHPEFAADLEIISFLPREDALDELNECLQCSGRIAYFADRLAAMVTKCSMN